MKKTRIKILSGLLILALLFILVAQFSGVMAQSPTSTASATPTATPGTLPDAGVSMPTFIGMAIGIIAILFSLALAL